MFSNFPTHYEKQLTIEIYLKETLIIETASVSKQNLNVEKSQIWTMFSQIWKSVFIYFHYYHILLEKAEKYICIHVC